MRGGGEGVSGSEEEKTTFISGLTSYCTHDIFSQPALLCYATKRESATRFLTMPYFIKFDPITFTNVLNLKHLEIGAVVNFLKNLLKVPAKYIFFKSQSLCLLYNFLYNHVFFIFQIPRHFYT